MSSPPPLVRHISKSTVKPPSRPPSATSNGSLHHLTPSATSNGSLHHLTPWDLAMLSAHYIQKGLLFSNLPPSLTTEYILHRLKSSLSAALLHFYPLAGRLTTQQKPEEDGKASGMFVSISCNGEGAEFIHAVADKVTVADVLGPLDDLPTALVQLLFPLDVAVNHDGHSLPLLAVQLTELADGVFVACSFNHVVGDGTSYWHFFNAWAEISRAGDGGAVVISRPPVHDRWFIDGVGNPPFKLPFSHPDEFIERHPQPRLRERMFHFSAGSIARLKAKANEECGTHEISSFQALCSLMWRSITRARRLPAGRETSCRLAIQNRPRMRPPLSPDYFGNSIYAIGATATAGELLAHGLGWGAREVQRCVAAHDDGAIRSAVRGWHASPIVYGLSMFDPCSVMMGSSPRFDMYGCDFGWGKAAALRSGNANKFDGKVSSYPGWEGGGSVDLEVCLVPDYMSALESDAEFMAAVSPAPHADVHQL